MGEAFEGNTSAFKATPASPTSCWSTWKEETSCNSDYKATLDTKDTDRHNVANTMKTATPYLAAELPTTGWIFSSN